jgi:hypothetical protein
VALPYLPPPPLLSPAIPWSPLASVRGNINAKG